MNKLVQCKIAHTLSNLMTHIQTLLSCSVHLYTDHIYTMKISMNCFISMQIFMQHTCEKITFSSEDSTVKNRCCLFRLTYSSRLPSDMNGIIIMGTSPSKHSPISDMTFWCLKESIRDTSFNNFNLSPSDDRAEDETVSFEVCIYYNFY